MLLRKSLLLPIRIIENSGCHGGHRPEADAPFLTDAVTGTKDMPLNDFSLQRKEASDHRCQ